MYLTNTIYIMTNLHNDFESIFKWASFTDNTNK